MGLHPPCRAPRFWGPLSPTLPHHPGLSSALSRPGTPDSPARGRPKPCSSPQDTALPSEHRGLSPSRPSTGLFSPRVHPAAPSTGHLDPASVSLTAEGLGTRGQAHLRATHTCVLSTPACRAAASRQASRARGHWGDEAPQQGPPPSAEVPSSASPHLPRPGGVARGFKGLERGQVWGQVPGQRWPWKGAPSGAGAPWTGGERSWRGSGLPAGVPSAAESRLPPATHSLQDAEPVPGSRAGRCAPRARMGRRAPRDARP